VEERIRRKCICLFLERTSSRVKLIGQLNSNSRDNFNFSCDIGYVLSETTETVVMYPRPAIFIAFQEWKVRRKLFPNASSWRSAVSIVSDYRRDDRGSIPGRA
jgi:hypothetical protein